MKKVKICFILSDEFPVPAVCGGAIETLMTSLATQNDEKSNYEFTICSVYHENVTEAYEKITSESVKMFWTHPETTTSKIKHIIFRFFRKIFKIKIWGLHRHYGEVKKLISEEKFDLVIAEGGNFEAKAKIAKMYKKENLVIHVHHHYIPEDIVTQMYGVVLGVSDFVTREYKKYCDKEIKSYTLRNAINIKKFEVEVNADEIGVLRAQLGLEKDDFIVLYVGRIIDVKGVKELMEAVVGIPDSSVKLLVIGSANFAKNGNTPYLEEVKELTEKYSKRIVYTGYIENSQIYKYAAAADVQCVPSLWEEAAGLVVLEGMASGLPTIVTNSGGMVEYITKDTSIVIDRGDKMGRSLQEAILYLKENNDVREAMSRASKEHVKQYDEKQYYDNFIKVIQDIVENKE